MRAASEVLKVSCTSSSCSDQMVIYFPFLALINYESVCRFWVRPFNGVHFIHHRHRPRQCGWLDVGSFPYQLSSITLGLTWRWILSSSAIVHKISVILTLDPYAPGIPYISNLKHSAKEFLCSFMENFAANGHNISIAFIPTLCKAEAVGVRLQRLS
jgi:hypothetical protein